MSEGKRAATGKDRRGPLGDYVLAGGVALAVVLYVFRSSIERQLGGLHGPGSPSYSYGDLHGAKARAAAEEWRTAQGVLHDFQPVKAATLIHQRSAVALALIAVLAVVLWVGVSRLAHSRLPKLLVALFALSASVVVAVDLSIAVHLDDPAAVSDPRLPWLPWLPFVCLAVLVPFAWRPFLKGARRRVATYRASPASGRLALGVSIGFFVLFNIGDIGAQIEDLLRRDLTSGHGRSEAARLAVLVGTLVVFNVVLKALGDLDEPPGADPNPGKLLLWGAGLTVAGAVLMVVADTQSALLVLGVVMGVIGGFSRVAGRAVLPKSARRTARGAAGLLLLSVPLLVLGWRFDAGAHRWLVVLAAGPVLLGAGLLYAYIARVAVDQPASGEPVGDADGTGALVVSWLFVVAGLLVISFRVLGGVLATTGSNPPVFLLAFQALLFIGGVLGLWHISASAGSTWVPALAATGAPRSGPTEDRKPRIPPMVPIGAVAPLASVIALLSLTVWPDAATSVGRAVRPIGLTVLSLASVAAIAGVIRRFTRSTDQPAIFRALGFHRTPVIGLLVTWLLLVNVAGVPLENAAATSHSVRLLAVAPHAAPAAACPRSGALDAIVKGGGEHAAMAGELCRWIDDVIRFEPSRQVLPLVLVTASGGGVRAAAWTDRVLDCMLFAGPVESCPKSSDPRADPRTLERADRWPFVFAAGGASGGSVGVATAAAAWLAPSARVESGPAVGWARTVAEPDHVAPVFGQMLAAEMGLAAVGVVPEHDRAETLIDDWASSFGQVDEGRCPAAAGIAIRDLGFLQASTACAQSTPLMLFNGTVVRSGSRFDISPLTADDAGHDRSLGLRDVLCPGEDIPFFDAAFLSSRFPLVTPSGRIGYERPPGCRPRHGSPVDVVDGGYHENSGTAQVAELWVELQPLIDLYNGRRAAAMPEIRPVLLQIENGEIGKPIPQCPPTNPPVGPGPPSVKTSPTPVVGGDRSVRFGEPLRVLWAGIFGKFVAPHDESDSKDALIDAMCARGIPVLTMGLYGHPGRALPLGWSLTGDVLDDMEHVFALEPNACRARAFVDYFKATRATPVRPVACNPG